MSLRILAVATEWFPGHGGVSTVNRALCVAFSKLGHEVYCLVPSVSAPEVADAEAHLVNLVEAPPAVGVDDTTRLCLPLDRNIGHVDVVIGHAHVTGPAAAIRCRYVEQGAKRVHILHTSPEEIEWLKERSGTTATERAEGKQKVEAALAESATLAVAVGPRLAREWTTHLPGLKIHRLNPGLPDAPQETTTPGAAICLVLGRAEDLNIKGHDIAAAALGLLRKNDAFFSGPNEPTLQVRGAHLATADQLREDLARISGTGLRVNVKQYTEDQAEVRKDIRRASVVLMPSRAEGFGLVALEAIANGVPIIASMRSGLSDLLLERKSVGPENAYIDMFVADVQGDLAHDASVWATSIATILKDRDTAFTQARRLRDSLAGSLFWDRAASEIVSALEIEGGRANRGAAPFDEEHKKDLYLWAESDPVVAVAMATSSLESRLAEFAVEEGARVGEPPETYIRILKEKNRVDTELLRAIQELIRRKNIAVHEGGRSIDGSMARGYVDDLTSAMESLNAISFTAGQTGTKEVPGFPPLKLAANTSTETRTFDFDRGQSTWVERSAPSEATPRVVAKSQSHADAARVISALRDWAQRLTIDNSDVGIAYERVDIELGLTLGTTKRLLSQAIPRSSIVRGTWILHEERDDTFRLRWSTGG